MMSDERRQKLEERATWLEGAIAGLRRSYARTPWLVALLLLAIPAGMLGGALAGFYVAFMAVALASVTVYIAWSHLTENEAELKAIRAELRAAQS